MVQCIAAYIIFLEFALAILQQNAHICDKNHKCQSNGA